MLHSRTQVGKKNSPETSCFDGCETLLPHSGLGVKPRLIRWRIRFITQTNKRFRIALAANWSLDTAALRKSVSLQNANEVWPETRPLPRERRPMFYERYVCGLRLTQESYFRPLGF